MKNAPRKESTKGVAVVGGAKNSRPARFAGTDNPRHLRVLHALLVSPRPREAVDRIAGCSNGPDLVKQLRRRGLDVPCQKTPCIDRDGREVERGIYYLTRRDRIRVRRWQRTQGRRGQA